MFRGSLLVEKSSEVESFYFYIGNYHVHIKKMYYSFVSMRMNTRFLYLDFTTQVSWSWQSTTWFFRTSCHKEDTVRENVKNRMCFFLYTFNHVKIASLRDNFLINFFFAIKVHLRLDEARSNYYHWIMSNPFVTLVLLKLWIYKLIL